MVNLTSRIEWHDIRIDPDDLPEEDEEVLVTIENQEGDRRVLSGAYPVLMENDRICWCTKDGTENVALWYEVIAWAYYPDPYLRW